jgi:hypothetical protein
MALEVGTFISDLVATNPTSTDPKAEGDDHIRLLKSTVKATFPNVSGAVLPTHTELNFVDGVTSAIQGQLDTKAPIASPTFTGTVTIPSGASIAGFAPLASPALTGVPTAPTAAPGTGTTQIATTEFVVSQAFSSALPGQTGNSGKYLSTNGTAASWETVAAVSSVGMTVPSFLSVANSPITSAGTLAVTYSGTALPVANGGTGVTTSTGSGANVLSTSPALSGAILNDGYTEEIFAVTGTTPALSPTNGSVQTWTLTGASTPTAGTWANGQSITLLIDDGTANTITWTSLAVTWKTNGGSAPTLLTTGLTVIQLWKVGDVIYGARVGDA